MCLVEAIYYITLHGLYIFQQGKVSKGRRCRAVELCVKWRATFVPLRNYKVKQHVNENRQLISNSKVIIFFGVTQNGLFNESLEVLKDEHSVQHARIQKTLCQSRGTATTSDKGKDKLVPVQASCREDVWGSEGTSSVILTSAPPALTLEEIAFGTHS